LGLVCGVATADTVTLATGRQMSGTLEKVSFLAGEKRVALARAAIADLKVRKTAVDVLTPLDGAPLEGRVISITFRTVGGSLTFRRRELLLVELAADPLAEARKQLEDKKAQIDAGDAGALFELAQWCLTKGLRAEALALAESCLEADPESPCAEEAHGLLGHVHHKGRWLTQTEYLRLVMESGGDLPTRPGAEGGGVALDARAVSASDARATELYKDYIPRADELSADDLDQVKAKYQGLFSAISAQIAELDRTIAHKRAVREYYGVTDRAKDRSRGHAVGREGAWWKKDGLAEDVKAQNRLKLKMRLVAAKAKKAIARAAGLKDLRRTRLRNALTSIKHKLEQGKAVSEDEMITLFEDALVLD